MSTFSENQWASWGMSVYAMANFSFISFQLASIMIKWFYFFSFFYLCKS